MKNNKSLAGFTLIEILVVIGIIAVLAAVVLIAINPARQFAQARNSQRSSNVNALLNSVGQYMADNKGSIKCFTDAGLDATHKVIKNTGGVDAYDCIVPAYMNELPYDPNRAGAHVTSKTDYDTGYEMWQNASTTRITVSAPGAELTQTIEITR